MYIAWHDVVCKELGPLANGLGQTLKLCILRVHWSSADIRSIMYCGFLPYPLPQLRLACNREHRIEIDSLPTSITLQACWHAKDSRIEEHMRIVRKYWRLISNVKYNPNLPTMSCLCNNRALCGWVE